MKLCSKPIQEKIAVALCFLAAVLQCLSSAGPEAIKGQETVLTAVPSGPGNADEGALDRASDGRRELAPPPPRRIVGLHWVKNGWVYNCMECHKILQARWHYEQPPNEHKQIRLEHGNNRFCLNCHHPTNRNAFVDYDGAEIAEADVVQLCAKCHGTIYRDWSAGVHGRENGFWKASLGAKAKLRCIECHDPHSPRFKPLQPLPPLRYPPRGAHPPIVAHSPAAAHRTGP